jgi:hypothetical protein
MPLYIRLSHNLFNPTTRSLLLINLSSCDEGCVFAAGGGLT